MAEKYAKNYTKINNVPRDLVTGDYGAKVYSHFDAYVTDGTEQVGDRVWCGRINDGERIVGGDVLFDALGAGVMLTLGDAGAFNRFLAFSSAATAGQARVAGLGWKNTSGLPVDVFLTIGGAVPTAGKAITVIMLAARI